MAEKSKNSPSLVEELATALAATEALQKELSDKESRLMDQFEQVVGAQYRDQEQREESELKKLRERRDALETELHACGEKMRMLGGVINKARQTVVAQIESLVSFVRVTAETSPVLSENNNNNTCDTVQDVSVDTKTELM